MADSGLVARRIVKSGAFFERDPKITVRQNIHKMMDAIATEAEGAVRASIEANRGSMKHYTGRSADAVRGRTRSLVGKSWQVTAVVSPNAEGLGRADSIRIRASSASIERRFHPYRKTASALRGSRAVLRANLTEGIE